MLGTDPCSPATRLSLSGPPHPTPLLITISLLGPDSRQAKEEQGVLDRDCDRHRKGDANFNYFPCPNLPLFALELSNDKLDPG